MMRHHSTDRMHRSCAIHCARLRDFVRAPTSTDVTQPQPDSELLKPVDSSSVFYFNFAYSALACFRMGMSGFYKAESLGHSTPLITQMSPPCGRKRSNITHLPSGDQTG